MKTQTRIAAAAILAGALVLRIVRLTFQPLWADEGYSVYFASLDLGALTWATAADIHPPLYYYLLKVWMLIFGSGEAALRLLSVGLGVLTVACTYAIARSITGSRVTLVAVLFLTISPFHIYYSQEVRMYALVGLLAVASTLSMIHFLGIGMPVDETSLSLHLSAGHRRFRYAILYVLTTVLALYTLYYAAFLLVAQTLYVLLVHRRWRTILSWLFTQIAVLLLYAPWLVIATDALTRYVAGKVAVEKYLPLDPLTFFATVLATMGIGMPSAERWFLLMGAVPIVGLAALGVVVGQSRQTEECGKKADLLLALLVVIPIACGYLVNLFWPFNPNGFPRLFLYCLPFFAILVGQGIDWLIKVAASKTTGNLPARGALMLSIVAGAFLIATLADFYLSPRYARHDYRPLVQDMSALAHPDDVVIAFYPWQLGFVRSYFIGQLPHLVLIEQAAQWADDQAIMQRDLEELGQQYRRLWFPSFEAAGGLLEGKVTAYLNDYAFPGLARWYGDHRLALYFWGDLPPAQRKDVMAGENLVLESVRTSLEPLESGRDGVRVELLWRALGTLPAGGQISLRLVDENNRSWASRDSAPRNGSLPMTMIPPGLPVIDRHAVPIPATTPPGSYRLLVGVYDRESGRNLPLTDTSGRGLGSELEIARVVVTRSTYHPPLQALPILNRMTARFTGGPRLVGYALYGAVLRPGHPIRLDLYWQAEKPIEDDIILFVQARDRVNKVWGLYEGVAVGPQYPPTRWSVGEILRSQVSFLLSADAPAGKYQLTVGWLRGPDKERLPVVGGGNEVILTRVTAIARTHVTTLPRPAFPMDERLGDVVQFLGYDKNTDDLAPGSTLELTLYWRALARMDIAYTVFVHIVDEQERIHAQDDKEPRGGEIPTTSWLPGEVISDTYSLALPANLPQGTYTLLTGMYHVQTGARLPVQTATDGHKDDAIELGRLFVAGP